MLAPFHIAVSMMVFEVVRRGAPNSVVRQVASKPSAETVEVSGKVLPLKLGLGQDERKVALSSLPGYCSVNEPVPRRLMLDLNCMRLLPFGAIGAFASTSAAPRQGNSSPVASRH